MNSPVFDAEPTSRSSINLDSLALRLLAITALGTVAFIARTAFVPIALALLFSLVLSTPVEALHRRGLPRSAAALLVLLLLGGLVAGGVNLLWTPAQSWWASAPQTMRTIEKRLRPAATLIGRVEMLSDEAGQIGQGALAATGSKAETARPAAAPPAPSPSLAQGNTIVEVITAMRTALMGVLTVTIVTLFALAGGPPMLARMSAAVAKDLHSSRTLQVIDAVRIEVGRYYMSFALINLSLGLMTAAITWLLGMPNPLLWGAVAAVLNFVPYVGPAITLLLLTIVAFVSFDGIGHVLAVSGSYLALATIEGQVVQPLGVGHRLELSPVIIFLSLWFWGWFWGIPGIILAVPSLVAIKVVAEHSKHGHPLVEFLSPNRISAFHAAEVVTTLALRSARKRMTPNSQARR